MDQVLALRQMCEKYLTNGRDLFWAFMDLEKAYYTIYRHGLWQMLRVYGVGGKLLQAVQSFYIDSWACVRVGNDMSKWFPVNLGLKEGCVLPPLLFNVYMDGEVRDVNVTVLGKWLKLLSNNGSRFEINRLLFGDDSALVAESEEKLSRLVGEFGRVFERRKLRVNID